MTNQNGSILLTLSTIALLMSVSLTGIFISNSAMHKNTALFKLKHQNNKFHKDSVSQLINTTENLKDITTLPKTLTSSIVNQGNQLTQTSHLELSTLPGVIPVGYSINSVFNSHLIISRSSSTSKWVKSVTTHIGQNCLTLISKQINSPIHSDYPYGIVNSSLNYKIDRINGHLLRQTNQGKQLLLDFDIEPDQILSRGEFYFVTRNGSTHLGIAFIKYNSNDRSVSNNNALYLIFDDPLFNSNQIYPFTENDLIQITDSTLNIEFNQGYKLNLGSGKLLPSAMITANHQLFFVIQSFVPSTNTTTEHAYKLDLSLSEKPALNLQPVIASSGNPEIKILLDNNQLFKITSTSGYLLYQFENQCRKIYQYDN